MREYLIQAGTLSEIADAIRAKTNTTDPFPVSSMASMIDEIDLDGDSEPDLSFIKGITEGTISYIDDEGCNFTSIFSLTFHPAQSEHLIGVSFSNVITIGDSAFYDCQLLTSVSLPNVISIGSFAFERCFSLTSISLPNATTIGTCAFNLCYSLQSISFPNVTTIGNNVFQKCSSLQSISLPNATTIGSGAFSLCSSLQVISLPNVTTIRRSAFRSCYSLMHLYLNGISSVPTLESSAFTSTPIELSFYTGSYGSIHVPRSLFSAFKTASNWKYYSARMVSV